nr:PQQ-binding-like beta-propeller repeat protein [Streptomyces sp. SID3343]
MAAGDPVELGGYRLVAVLGSGGMGRVYLGRSPAGRAVAVKVVHARVARDPRFRARFAREVRAARRVDGAFTASVLDHDADAARPWLVTVYLPGLTLAEAVRRHGPLPDSATRLLGAALAEALASIHAAGVVHRDLKPGNVLLTREGPRVVDFGISRLADENAITSWGALVGTPGYLAPEFLSSGVVSPAGDVFALGGLLLFAATGEEPHGSGAISVLLERTLRGQSRLDVLRTVLPHSRVTELVAACLSRSPEQRPTPREVLTRLAADPDEIDGLDWLPEGLARGVVVEAAAADRTLAAVRGKRSALGPGGWRRPGRRAFLVSAVAAAGAGAYGITLSRRRRHRPASTSMPESSVGTVWVSKVRSARTIVVSGQVVYVVGEGLTAIEAVGGGRLWDREKGPFPNGIVAQADGAALFGGDGRNLYALHAGTGRPLADWQVPEVGVVGRPALWGPRVFVCDGTGRLTGCDRNGGIRITTDLAGIGPYPDRAPDVAVAGDTLYVPFQGLRALDPADGRVKWSFASGSSGTATVRDDTVYLVADQRLWALDRAGRMRWSFALRSRAGAAPTVVGGVVYVGDESGLHALEATTGAHRWRFATGGPVTSSPVVLDDTVYTGADRDRVYAVATRDGSVRWTYPAGRQDTLGLGVFGRTLVATLDGSEVRALRL